MSNTKLLTVNRFVAQARKVLGPIRIKSLVEDSDYQVNLLLQAMFETQHGLEGVALECCDALGIDKRWLLQSQQFEAAYPVNATSRQMLRSSIVFLVQSLKNTPPKPNLYRLAVNSLLELPFVHDKVFAAQLCRDFYAIVVKPLNTEMQQEAPQPEGLDATESTLLMDIWANVDTEPFSPTEGMALNAYLQLLKQEAIKLEQAQLRVQLAKVILMTTRGKQPRDSSTYRQAAEAIKRGIAHQTLVDQFITVIRQFYPYWQLV